MELLLRGLKELSDLIRSKREGKFIHCEGDEALLEDITEFLQGKGIEISA